MPSGARILATVLVDPLVERELGHLLPVVTAPDDGRATLLALVPEAVCLISRGNARIDGPLMDAAPKLRVVARNGHGYENVDVAAATLRGIPLVYAPLLDRAVAEATFAMILALTKNLFYWHQCLVTGQWDRRITERTTDLHEATLGIIGVGRIGRRVAQLGAAFGMRLVGHDPYLPPAVGRDLGLALVSIPELLATADVISLNAVATPETRAIINRANLRHVKRGAYLVNFARGALIENLDILHEALEDGRLAGVGLDVFPEEPPRDLRHPLFAHPHFLGAPHVLASTKLGEARCYRSMCQDILAVLEGRRPEWCVNPEVFESRALRKA